MSEACLDPFWCSWLWIIPYGLVVVFYVSAMFYSKDPHTYDTSAYFLLLYLLELLVYPMENSWVMLLFVVNRLLGCALCFWKFLYHPYRHAFAQQAIIYMCLFLMTIFFHHPILENVTAVLLLYIGGRDGIKGRKSFLKSKAERPANRPTFWEMRAFNNLSEDEQYVQLDFELFIRTEDNTTKNPNVRRARMMATYLQENYPLGFEVLKLLSKDHTHAEISDNLDVDCNKLPYIIRKSRDLLLTYRIKTRVLRCEIIVKEPGNLAEITSQDGTSLTKQLQIKPGSYKIDVAETRDDSLVITGMQSLNHGQYVGGRPALLDEEDRKVAIKLFKDTSKPLKEIAKILNISIATLYRYFPGGRKKH